MQYGLCGCHSFSMRIMLCAVGNLGRVCSSDVISDVFTDVLYKSAHLCSGVICKGHNTNVVSKLVCFISMNKSLIKKRSLFLCYIQLKNIFTIINY